MPMSIIVAINNEEHNLIIHPGDRLIDMLRDLTRNIDYCSFSVINNGIETASSLQTLSEGLRNNTIINVSPPVTRGAPVSFNRWNSLFELKSTRNPRRPIIQIETVHISCSSDSYDSQEDMVGLLVYSFDDQQQFELNGHRCRTGYILIKMTKNIVETSRNQGLVHGKLFKWFFGIEPDQRFVGAGFALLNGKVKFNSSVFNATSDDYHDDSRSMSRNEIDLIKYAIDEWFVSHKWKQNPTLSVAKMQRSAYDSDDHLPIQNHPQHMGNTYSR